MLPAMRIDEKVARPAIIALEKKDPEVANPETHIPIPESPTIRRASRILDTGFSTQIPKALSWI